ARLVDVNFHLLVESPPGRIDPWMPLLAITGDREEFAKRYSSTDEESVLSFFTLDPENPSSIRSCISAARENCRALRHRISSELWLVINTLHLDALKWTPESMLGVGVYTFFAELREWFYLVSGVIRSTIPRGVGYDFLGAGRWLESAENISRLLDTKYHFLLPSVEDIGSPLDLAQWAALLRSASALEAYRQSYGNDIRPERVVEFLLFDASFPRAARYCMDRLEGALGRIAGGVQQREAPERIPTAHALAVRMRAGSAGTVIADGLHEYLLGIQDDCALIGDEINQVYLRCE
ncbi:MAG TPA: alpha-E domain-containing protein, partial [Candidatus Binataceae bacterium]|nr:alpha-E domain-containing protein [Candidatus Binataceae bacterium]